MSGKRQAFDGAYYAVHKLLDDKYSDLITINRTLVDDYMLVNLSTGISAEDWGVELYIDNLTDERAEQSRNYIQHQDRATIVRPMTIGIRLSQDF